MATFGQMAEAVLETNQLATKWLAMLEEMSRRQGVEPGPDLGFAGIRISIARADRAIALLRRQAPHETEILALLDAKPKTPATV